MVAPSRILSAFAFPQRLLVAAALASIGVFVLLRVYGQGHGIGQGFYVPLILVAAAAGPFAGVVAAVCADVLYQYAIHSTDFTATSSLTRLAGFLAAAIVTGLLARGAARMLGEALEHLDHLIELSRASLDAASTSERRD